MTETVIPSGYWMNAQGSLVPIAKVSPYEKARHQMVSTWCVAAEAESDRIAAFKANAMQAVQEFMDFSLAEYKVKPGGKKGNITLQAFDGLYKIERKFHESLVFDERLQVAKALIDECIHAWSKNSNNNIRALIIGAFDVDKQGKINTGRVLNLRRLKIDDEKWALAMKAIADSIQTAGSKPYIRFYKRDAAGSYQPIVLDIAAL